MLKSGYMSFAYFLLLFAVTAIAALLYLRTVRPFDEMQLVAAGVAGFFAGTLSFSVGGLVESRRRVRALRAASAGVMPQDGEFSAFSGVIHSDQPLQGPISERAVVSYQYIVDEPGRGGHASGTTSGTQRCFTGSALAPAALRTAIGSLPLLGWPGVLDPVPVDRQTANQNFRAYAARTEFESRMHLDTVLMRSPHRQDLRAFPAAPRSWDKIMCFETYIANGEEVTIFGWYVAGKGIGGDPKGDLPMSVYRTTDAWREFREEFRQGISGVIVAPLLVVAVVLAYEYLLPMLE